MILSILKVAPPFLLVLPFIALLLFIALGSAMLPSIWLKFYKQISVSLGLTVVAFYIFVNHDFILPVESFSAYLSFISMLTFLYVVSGGIYISTNAESQPLTNVLFLLVAAALTNIIGTTGASVLLIRPYIRFNRHNLKPFHIVFFIFIVSNAGGLLTPIGDPPLFIGFLMGIPFSWTLLHLWPVWLMVVGILLIIFYFMDQKNSPIMEMKNSTNKICISGKRNLLWLGVGIGTIFLDPNIIEGLPYIDFEGKKLSYIREIIQLAASVICYFSSSKIALKSNQFNFEPMKEIAFLFFGIFLCMMPAIQTLEVYAHTHKGAITLTPGLVYWSGGLFSTVLDNAPAYINMMALILAQAGLNMHNVGDVRHFLETDQEVLIEAISAGCVFFGAMTYIGNGPNFMVKAIAEREGVKMPGFAQYIWQYSLPILLPVLVLVWVVFYL